MTTPVTVAQERTPVSQNGTGQSQPQQTSSGIDKLLIANTSLAVWLLFLAIGGGLLALYYARIGYLPDIEWNATLTYLFIGSMVGGVIGLLLTMSLYLPGIIWSEIILFDPTLDNYLSYELKYKEPDGKESRRKEPCMRSMRSYLGLPFLWALLTSHLVLRVSTWVESLMGSSFPKRLDLYWIIAVGILIVTFFVMRKTFRDLLKPAEKDSKEQDIVNRQIFKFSIWFTLSVLLNQISMYLVYRLAGRTPDLIDFIVLTGMCSTAVWISTYVVAARHRYYPRQALIASLVVAAILLFAADGFSSLSMRLMSYYGLGGGVKVTLLMTDEGARTVNGLGLTSSQTPVLPDVEILSKVGDYYYLNVNGKTFTLPKKEVLSFQSVDRRPKK